MVSGLPRSSGRAASLSSIGESCRLSLGAWTTSAATTSRLPAATTAWALYHCSKPPPGTGMMRDSSSVRLTWSVGRGPSTGGWGGLPRGFLPVAAALVSRAASLARCSACSRSKRSLARASILARASASFASRSSRRASSSGIDRPSGRSARSAASALASNSATSAFSCASILPACSYDSALWRLALAWILVPSSATVPILSTPISRATASTWTNNPSISWRNRRRNAAIVSLLVRRDEAERHRVIARPLQLAAREHAGRVAVHQDAQQQRRRGGRRARAAVAPPHPSQIQAVDHLHHEASQMLLRQPLVNRRRQKEPSLAVDRPEVAHRGKILV